MNEIILNLETKRTIARMTADEQRQYLSDMKAGMKAARTWRRIGILVIQAIALVTMLAGCIGAIITSCILFHTAGMSGEALAPTAVHAVVETCLLIAPGIALGLIAFEQDKRAQAANKADREKYKTACAQAEKLNQVGNPVLDI